MKKLSVILLTVIMSVMMVVPAFAAKYNGYEAPEVETNGSYDEYPYVYLFIENGELRYRGTKKPLIKERKSNGEYLTYSDGSQVTSTLYFIKDDKWKSLALNSGDVQLWTIDIVWSNYDIYDSNGEVYFYAERPPLSEVINNVVDDTLNNDTVPSVVNTFKTLAYVGVGLLAMLVVLELFGKRSLIKR